jgi:PAS domain S-box-containing protein
MNLIRYFFFIFLHGIALAAVSQKQNMRFEHLGTDQGLSQSNVICILQDSRGFMWFGTRDGLNKYDGYKFTVYKNDAGDPGSLSNNFIRDIAEDKNGDLWIATLGGLCRYDRQKNRFTSYKHDSKNSHSISGNLITSILEDSGENIWIGTERGLNMYDKKRNQFVHYTYDKNADNSLGDVFVRTIFEDSRHDLWVGTFNGGLNLFNRKNKTFTRFQHNENDSKSISSNNVYTMFEDSKHRLWLGTNGGGLELFNKLSGDFSHFKHDDNKSNSVVGNSVYAINEDNEKNLWIGTENGGLSLLNPETGLFYTYQNDVVDNTSLSNNSVYAIYKDTKSNIWLGTFNGGVDMVNPDAAKFTHYKHILNKNSLSNNNVLCIYEDAQKNIWIGTDGGGLNLFDPQTGHFTHFGHEKNNKNSICGNYVLSICGDSKGNIWIGTWGDGVTVFNKTKGTFKHFKNDPHDPSSLSNNNAWKIFEDKEKNLWIGTYGGGLNLFDPLNNSFTRYQYNAGSKTGISGNNIQSILEDSEGKLWITTDGGGLNQFDKKNKTFSRFLHDDKKNSIINNSAGSIYEDRNKNLWIGTMAGLSFLDKKTNSFVNYTTSDGLPNNVIFGILEDQKGNLWISTNKGISRFDPVNKVFKNFGLSDGLQSNEFKQQAYCKSSSGAMYFGGNNGFNQFFPDSIKANSFAPPLVITSFQIFNKEVPVSVDSTISPLKKDISETKEITISYRSSVISFGFASLNYTIPEKKQYAYMLEGFDKTWNEVGVQRTATYTNLDPGEYIFKVKGMNNDGNWSDSVTSIRLTITPPFWLTWWFKSISALFIVACFAAFYKMRIKAITKQKALLEKQVKERTDEIVLQKEKLSKNIQELAALKESLEKEKYFLDSLMDNMPDAIYFKDKESKMIRVSKYMAHHFGTSVENLIGKTDFDFQDADHAKEAFEDEQNIQKTRTPKIDYIEKEVDKDGTEYWVSTTKMPLINARGEVVGTFGMSRDVTKVKMLEQERHEAILDKAVAQGKFEIAADVMHDIGNAVVGFGSYLTRIRRLQNEDNPDNLKNLAIFFEKQKESIAAAIGEVKADAVIKMLSSMAQTQKASQDEIGKSITEQLNIITNIQEILNIQRQYITGHGSQERKPVNLRNIINDSLAMLFASIDKMAIAVSLNMPADLPIIKGDRTKLVQVFLNILKNSIEAFDINAPEKTISLSAVASNGNLILQVKDSGKGFDKSTTDQLFKRGFSTKSSGSGMGLHNCRAIVESHEGTIDITSEGQGKGSLTTIGFKI